MSYFEEIVILFLFVTTTMQAVNFVPILLLFVRTDVLSLLWFFPFSLERDFRPMLGGVTYDKDGKIIGKAWF